MKQYVGLSEVLRLFECVKNSRVISLAESETDIFGASHAVFIAKVHGKSSRISQILGPAFRTEILDAYVAYTAYRFLDQGYRAPENLMSTALFFFALAHSHEGLNYPFKGSYALFKGVSF